ncbi:SDR family NAD(P)-dependent oxidoreductase [Subtercola frigoramans]|uniref:Cyclic-di-GMP-binding biofilm dispersal mediator protein n=1 Tax=Subtercola frigoramans TaxID=120298 RepID=A0ABS2L3N1_9MICO|nr:SDR family NAD(P)-dependent oxidoreductase [Subtercola frigoramans]MBM7471648.1 cyclic-di-GMP-binding biofilm dispersal mediator protein [Subtercola frigoramans]
MTTLDGAVVLVVGASGGLGSRLASRLTAAGAVVVRGARNPQTLAGPDAYLADLTSPGAAAALLLAAEQAHPEHLDGIVIAAGAVAFGPIGELADDTLDELFAINTAAPIRLIRGAIPRLAQSAAAGRKPFIVTISGIVAESPTAGMAAYSASKAALAAFVQAASRELRRSGIRVIDARPGHTETGLAGHPIAGSAPAFAPGLDADTVAERIITAIVGDEKDLPSTAF